MHLTVFWQKDIDIVAVMYTIPSKCFWITLAMLFFGQLVLLTTDTSHDKLKIITMYDILLTSGSSFGKIILMRLGLLIFVHLQPFIICYGVVYQEILGKKITEAKNHFLQHLLIRPILIMCLVDVIVKSQNPALLFRRN